MIMIIAINIFLVLSNTNSIIFMCSCFSHLWFIHFSHHIKFSHLMIIYHIILI